MSNIIVSDIIREIESVYPRDLAEAWDNPGLLCGRHDREVNAVLLALDASNRTVERAAELSAGLIVTHHPMIFGKITRVTDEDPLGRKLLKLIEHGTGCYAMHTNFDIARKGMAELAAKALGIPLDSAVPLLTTGDQEGEPVGIGFAADLPEDFWEGFPEDSSGDSDSADRRLREAALSGGKQRDTAPSKGAVSAAELAEKVKLAFHLPHVLYYDAGHPIQRIAVCPGSGRHMLREVQAAGADAFITGDTGHHDGMDYLDAGISLLDAGHFGIEQIFVKHMHQFFTEHFPQLTIYEEVTDERRYV